MDEEFAAGATVHRSLSIALWLSDGGFWKIFGADLCDRRAERMRVSGRSREGWFMQAAITMATPRRRARRLFADAAEETNEFNHFSTHLARAG